MTEGSSYRPTTATVAMSVVVVAGVTIGLFLRLWLIFHSPSSSDEGVAGLIAQGALHGHFTAFYWGQNYGGTAEPDLIALAFAVFGQTAVVAELVVAALSGIAAILTWRVARRIVPSTIAPLAGVLAWTAPAVMISDSVRVYGFRGVTLVCGMGLILLALQILDGRRHVITFAMFGLAAGVGWWSSPEIVYFAAPTVLLIVFAIVKDPNWREWWLGGAIAVGVAVIGALPWLWVNVTSGFVSLHHGASTNLTYSGRLRVVFEYTLPMQMGLRYADTGRWALHSIYPVVLCVVVAILVAAIVLCVARGGRALAIGLGVVAFPFLLAISPFTGDWQDGRYGTYLVPLLALTLTIGACEAVRRLSAPPRLATMALSVMVALALVLAMIGVREIVNLYPASYTSAWGDPDAPTMAAISTLEAAGATVGYGGFWVPYKLDFLSQGRHTFTPVGTSRSTSIDDKVARQKRPAWIFVTPSEATIHGTQFVIPSLATGPGGMTESHFTARLRQLGIHYRVVDAGVLDAVIPDRTVTPRQAGIAG